MRLHKGPIPAGWEAVPGLPGFIRQKTADVQSDRSDELAKVLGSIEQLKGKDGKDGKDGINGKDGAQGPAGPQGPRGPQGAKGDIGPAGKDGKDGKPGKDGKDGKDGQDGAPGVGIDEIKTYGRDMLIKLSDGREARYKMPGLGGGTPFGGSGGGGGGGSGDVTGPASSTDNALARYDGTTGKVIQNSAVTLNDNGNLAGINGLSFNTSPTAAPTAVGSIFWDAGNGTPSVILDADVELQLGQENIVKVYNGSGATIAVGSVVAVAGAQGQRPSVVLADADTEPLSAGTLGIATESIANGAEGFVATFGVVRGLNTSAFTDGDPIYLSQTAGAFTATRPTAPAHTVFLGWVIKVNASSGEVFVNISNGWELDELHNVLISSPTNGQALVYESATGLWKNGTVSGGSSTLTISNKTGAYTVVAGDLGKIINCTSGTFTVALTAAATLGSGFNCWVWNTSVTGTDNVTINPDGTETIDGKSVIILRRGEGVQIICDGTNWQTGDMKMLRGYSENILDSDARPAATGSNSVGICSNASATGVSSIAIGTSTTASGPNSVAIGRNSANQGSQAVTGSGAMALGGSYASGTNSFAAAITNNTSTYGATGANSIAIGNAAKATAQNATAIGVSSVASGTYSVAISGGSVIGSAASGGNSFAFGQGAVSSLYGKYSYSTSGFLGAAGTGQTGTQVLYAATTDTTATPLTSNIGAASATNQVVLPNDSTYIFRGQLIARNTGLDTDSKAWEFKGAIRRGANAAATAIIGTPSIDLIASDGSAWSFTLTADTTNGGLAITVTGEAAKTIRWVCTVNTTEVTG